MSSLEREPPTAPFPTGLVLFAHGSRDPQWHRPMQAVREQLLLLQPNAMCLCAYLEISQPSLAQAIDQLVAGGCRRVQVLPLFLGTGRHARQDLPQLLAAAQHRHPQVQIASAPSVGENSQVIALMAQIALQLMHKE